MRQNLKERETLARFKSSAVYKEFWAEAQGITGGLAIYTIISGLTPDQKAQITREVTVALLAAFRLFDLAVHPNKPPKEWARQVLALVSERLQLERETGNDDFFGLKTQEMVEHIHETGESLNKDSFTN